MASFPKITYKINLRGDRFVLDDIQRYFLFWLDKGPGVTWEYTPKKQLDELIQHKLVKQIPGKYPSIDKVRIEITPAGQQILNSIEASKRNRVRPDL